MPIITVLYRYTYIKNDSFKKHFTTYCIVYKHIMCVAYILYKVQTIVLLLPSKL